MKKSFIVSAICALVAFASCQKQPTTVDPSYPDGKYSDVTFTLSDGTVVTKTVTTEANEKTIQNVQIFVFKGGTGADAGMLEISYSDGFTTPLNKNDGVYTTPDPIRCSSGEKEVYVIVNDAVNRTDQSYSIRTKAQLLDQKNELKDNAANKLLMIGNITKTFAEGDQTCSVEVKRICAAIVLRSIKNAFVSPAYQADGSFRIVEMYLLNVPAYQNFNMSSQLDASAQEAIRWYNKGMLDTEDAKKALTFDYAANTPKVVNYNGTYDTNHTFYMYPNACAFSDDATWGARATVLVVKTQINVGGSVWTDSYYPIALDKNPIKSNFKYFVDIVINRPGSNDPNKPTTFSDVTPTVTVLAWEDGDVYTPEI